MKAPDAIFLLALTACGSRTGDLIGSGYVYLPSSSFDGGGARGVDGGLLVHDASTGDVDDPCPSAVLAGSAQPMLMNCSTRDGRSRVVGPMAPHVTWKTPSIPIGTPSGAVFDVEGMGYGFVAIGRASGYDLRTGKVHWSVNVPLLADESQDLFFRASGALEGFSSVITGPIVATFDVANGDATPLVELGDKFNDVGPAAIGVDGSLYFAYLAVTAPLPGVVVVARVAPDGSVTWRSPALTGPDNGASTTMVPALGKDDMVLVPVTGELPEGGERQGTTLYALSSGTGAVLWATALEGPVGSVAVAADGSIVATSPNQDPQGDTGLFTCDSTGALASLVALPVGQLLAVARDGTLLFTGMRSGGVVAVRSGQVLWSSSAAWGGIDERSTVLVYDRTTIEGLDLATGSVRWKVKAPDGYRPCQAFYLAAGEVATLSCEGGAFGLAD